MTLVKPPERSAMNFGTFSMAVLAAAVRDIASIDIIDATDLGLQDAVKKAINGNPDVIGVTAMGLNSIGPVASFVSAVRGSGYNGTLVAGGHGASMMPMELLESGADAVVYGEGELTFRHLLLSSISENAQGLFLLRAGKLFKTPPFPLVSIDDLIEPARDLAKVTLGGVFLLETSRGCPHSCAFCETSRFNRGIWRARSPENVVKDVRRLLEIGATVVHIADDNFLASTERAIKICRLLSDGPLPLFFLISARSDDLTSDPELIPSLARANFLRVTVGVETVVPAILAKIKKNISFETHKKAFQAMKDAGIYTVASFIVGLPGETEAMRRRYVNAAIELADSATFLPFQPLPGTPLERATVDPEPWSIACAERLTREFERHPKVLQRLMGAAKSPTVRGALARASLTRRLNEKSLGEEAEAEIMKTLGKQH